MIDTYSKIGFAKLYTRKTPLTAADILNDRVIPFFDVHAIRVDRILTDRGTEYCGAHDRHEYELCLAVEDIDHTRTKVKSPQTNGICERLHKTLLDEFYRQSPESPTTASPVASEPGNPLLVIHGAADILRARMLAIACGYEDADDLDHLRSDPGFKLACGRLPATGNDPCSQPTMSRWENVPTLRKVVRTTYAMIDFAAAIPVRPPPSHWTSTTPSLSPTAISNSRCSMRITMNDASCRSMFMRLPHRGRWRFCCGPARHHRETKSAAICVVWWDASAVIGRRRG